MQDSIHNIIEQTYNPQPTVDSPRDNAPSEATQVYRSGQTQPGDTTTFAIGATELADSCANTNESHSIIVSPLPKGHKGEERPQSPATSSWLPLSLLILFFLVSFRYKNNFRYLKGILNDLTDVRSRHNLFDNTVRETTFLVLLNILCIVSSGILLYEFLSFQSTGGSSAPLSTAAVTTGAAAMFYTFQYIAFWCTGNVFSDKTKTSMWLKGFSSSQGLLGILLFPISMIGLFYPECTATIVLIATICFLAAKIVFICKGFRIFFTQTGSWVLFLYYLCNLEIVPLLLTYGAALKLSETIA